jgi:ubiquinone/menaquinone biosynthesis C-methylase UbiE
MNYLKSLKRIKESFLGGSEVGLIIDGIEKNSNTNNIALLDVGIGKGKFLKKVITTLKDRGFNFRIWGVDPVKERLSVARRVFPGANLFNKKFEEFKTKEKFDVINLTQSFYYLKNKEQMLEKISSMLNEGGVLIITLWSKNDDLCKLNNLLFGKGNIYNYSSEEALNLVRKNKSFSKADIKYFKGKVNFGLWKEQDQNLEGGLNVLARKKISQVDLPSMKTKLIKELKGFNEIGNRINGVVIAKKKFNLHKNSITESVLKSRFSKKNWNKALQLKGDNQALSMGCWEKECNYLEKKIVGDRVLDVCSGAGIRAIQIGKNHFVTGIEIDSNRVNFAEENKKIWEVEKNVTFVKGNAEDEKVYSNLGEFTTVLVDTDWRKKVTDDFKKHSINPFETSPRTDKLYRFLRKKYPSALISFRVSPRVRVKKFKELGNCIIEEIFYKNKLFLYYVYFKKDIKRTIKRKIYL